MGLIGAHPPVMLILAAFSRYRWALDWARDTAQQEWGPVALASDVFRFAETDYYTPTMGPDLQKTLFAFQQMIEPTELVARKIRTNQWEQLCRQAFPTAEIRPLNLDPGYLTEAKLVLASTKDHSHRIYLGHGIYAEVTLHYRHGQWRQGQWTFPDFRREDYHPFLNACRDYLRSHRRSQGFG
jgi:hypothetical protein